MYKVITFICNYFKSEPIGLSELTPQDTRYSHAGEFYHNIGMTSNEQIFFFHLAGCQAVVESCQTVMGKIPGQNMNYSDHEGVNTTLTISHSPTGNKFNVFSKLT